MQHILFTTDLSETSSKALSYLVDLVKIIDVRIDILHVFDSSAAVKQHIGANKDFSLQKHRIGIEASIKKLLRSVPSHQSGSCIVRDASYPSSMIKSIAEELNCDMICMGLRQKYQVSDRLLGTVTGRTMQSTSIPVLAIPNGAVYQQWKSILLITNKGDQGTPGGLTISFRDLLEKLDSAPAVHMLRLDLTTRQKEGFQKIHAILQKERLDLICIPSEERELLANLYHSGIPRTILFQTRLPVLLL